MGNTGIGKKKKRWEIQALAKQKNVVHALTAPVAGFHALSYVELVWICFIELIKCFKNVISLYFKLMILVDTGNEWQVHLNK